MTNHDLGSGAPLRRARLMTSAAATAVCLVTFGTAARADGAFDTSDADYQARGAQMVAAGRIKEQCLPVKATAPEAGWVAIPEPSAELIAAAAAEGQVVLNSGISDQPSIDAYVAAFELRYPQIKMTVAAGGSATMEERFLADHAAGSQQVDAVISNKLSWVKKAFKEGALTPLDTTVPGIFDHWPTGPWRWETDKGTTAPAFYRVLGIAYNSDLVKGADIPTDFKDMEKPAFKGQILAMDPEFSATFARVWKQIWNEVGDDGMRAIGENIIKSPLYTDVQPLAQALGAGGGMISMQMGMNVANTMSESGAPVVGVIPPRATGTQYVYGTATDAPHPNAAKLFAYWLYSSEGQWVTSCAAYAGTVAYTGYGAKEYVDVTASDEDIAKMKELLGL